MEILNATSEGVLHPKMDLNLMKSLGPTIRKYMEQKSRLIYTMGMKSTKFILQKILSIKFCDFFNK